MKQARPCCIRMRAREQLSAHIVRLRHSRCCCMYVWAHTSVRGIFSANVNLCVLRHCVVRVRSFRRRRFLYVNHSIPSACYKTLGLGQHHVQKPAPVGPCTKLKFRPGALIFAQAPAACPSQQTRTRAQVTIAGASSDYRGRLGLLAQFRQQQHNPVASAISATFDTACAHHRNTTDVLLPRLIKQSIVVVFITKSTLRGILQRNSC